MASTQTAAPALQVEGLRVAFGALVALDDVSWQVAPGEILGIIGPNGAGKSTCYNAATHLVRREGRVSLMGEDVTDVPAHRLAARGLRRAFQQNAFFGDLTVLENMAAVLQDERGAPSSAPSPPAATPSRPGAPPRRRWSGWASPPAIATPIRARRPTACSGCSRSRSPTARARRS